MHSPYPKRGFTLIELSIVLVIIGLIVGGVLVGQDLIKAAEIRKAAKQLEQYRTAVQAFRLKYNCIPGDCPTATQVWGAASWSDCGGSGNSVITEETCDGNGDNSIFSTSAAFTATEEHRFWQQLSLAKLIDGHYTGVCNVNGSDCYSGGRTFIAGFNTPVFMKNMAIQVVNKEAVGLTTGGGGAGWSWENSIMGNVFWVGNSPYVPWPTSGMPVDEAYRFDLKFDDGRPSTGNIKTDLLVGLGACINDAPETASYSSHIRDNCGLMIKAGF